MLKEQRWAAALSLLSCLASAQTYAGEDSKYPSNRYKPVSKTATAVQPSSAAVSDIQNWKARGTAAPAPTVKPATPQTRAETVKPAAKTAGDAATSTPQAAKTASSTPVKEKTAPAPTVKPTPQPKPELAEKPADERATAAPQAPQAVKTAPAPAAKPAAQLSPVAAAKPDEAFAGKTAETGNAKKPPHASPAKTASTSTKELPPPSIIETLLSLLLTGVFFLLLIKGNMLKGHG